MGSEPRDNLPCRVLQIQAVGHPGYYNCGPHTALYALCEDSTIWVQYHASPNSNVPVDGKWHPIAEYVER